MRFDLNSIPFFTLLFLPIFIAYNGYGLFSTLVVMAFWALVRQAIVVHGIMNRQKDKRLMLEGLPVSHYVEKVRWCLDKLEVPFENEDDAGILGIFMLGRFVPGLKIPAQNMTIYNSSDILRYLYGKYYHLGEEKVKFLEPTKEALEMEAKIDKMGFHLRRSIYYHTLELSPLGSDAVALKLWGIHIETIPQWQKVLLRALLPVLKAFLKKALNVTPEGSKSGMVKSKEFFKEIDDLLSDGRKFLLGTDYPTFVDISFASLAAILVVPEENYGGKYYLNVASKFKISDFSPEMQKESHEFRKTKAGKLVLKMFQEYRL